MRMRKTNNKMPIFNGLYIVSDDGMLFSTRRNKYLKPATDRYGYFYYVISIEGVRFTLKAHRLVAEAFIPNPENKPTVNHKNGIRNDNRVSNLEWATYRDQSRDPLTTIKRHKLVENTDYRAMGEKRNFGRKKTAVYSGEKLLGIFDSLKCAIEKYPANYGKASMCANGKRKSAGGVRFCYL